MDGELVVLDDANIDDFLAHAQVPVVVDFWAAWCGPCRLMAPSLEAIAGEQVGRIHVAKLDIEANALATERHQVQSLPTLIVFRGGEEMTRLVGMRGKAQLLTELAPYLA